MQRQNHDQDGLKGSLMVKNVYINFLFNFQEKQVYVNRWIYIGMTFNWQYETFRLFHDNYYYSKNLATNLRIRNMRVYFRIAGTLERNDNDMCQIPSSSAETLQGAISDMYFFDKQLSNSLMKDAFPQFSTLIVEPKDYRIYSNHFWSSINGVTVVPTLYSNDKYK